LKTQGYGWVRDLPDGRDLVYIAPQGAAIEILPKAVDLRAGLPPCYDQGNLGSCTANAIAAAIEFAEEKEGQVVPTMPSRLFIYYNERALEGSVSSDNGAQIRDGIKTVVAQGFCSEELWPYVEANFAVRPPDRCFDAALRDRVSQYLRLEHHLVPILACLASGFPFVFGFSVYESFETDHVTTTGIVPMPGPKERLLGGHAVVAVGYDLESRTFLVRNSWGPSWGLNGHFKLPFEYLLEPNLSADFWTIRKVPIPTHQVRP
jgi:C1A family cysteine protease